LLHIQTPLLLTFRAREKTQQRNDRGKKEIVNIGWQPVAPLEIVHALDMTCILPPRAEGYPVWKSDKIGEDFIIKLPTQFKGLFAKQQQQLDESIGRALAEWAKGSKVSSLGAAKEPASESLPPRADAGSTSSEPLTMEDYDNALSAASEQGMKELESAYKALPKEIEPMMRAAVNRRHKPKARKVDAARTEGAS